MTESKINYGELDALPEEVAQDIKDSLALLDTAEQKQVVEFIKHIIDRKDELNLNKGLVAK